MIHHFTKLCSCLSRRFVGTGEAAERWCGDLKVALLQLWATSWAVLVPPSSGRRIATKTRPGRRRGEEMDTCSGTGSDTRVTTVSVLCCPFICVWCSAQNEYNTCVHILFVSKSKPKIQCRQVILLSLNMKPLYVGLEKLCPGWLSLNH